MGRDLMGHLPPKWPVFPSGTGIQPWDRPPLALALAKQAQVVSVSWLNTSASWLGWATRKPHTKKHKVPGRAS